MIAPALLAAALFGATAPAPVSARPVLTVLYFDNNTGQQDLDVLRKGLADMIITDLVAWDGVSVVEREKLEAVIAELKLQQTRSFDPGTAVKVGKFLGAQHLLSGAMSAAGQELRVDAKIVRVEDGQVVTSATVRGPKDKIFDLEQELVDKITVGIDLKLKNQAARRRAKVPDLDALLSYSRALDLTDQGKIAEAQQAIQALVSKAPAFLMAREKKEQILARLKEQEKRSADIVSDSALELGKRSEAALRVDTAVPGRQTFDGLDQTAQRSHLTMHAIRAAYLSRVLKQSLSWREDHLRVVLKGKEAQALQVMRQWLDNQHRLVDELSRYQRLRGELSPGSQLEPEVANLMRDARMEAILHDPIGRLVAFVVEGRCQDGPTSYTVAPALGDLDPKEQKAAFDLLDAAIEPALAEALKADAARRDLTELTATQLLQRKAEALSALGRDEDAIATYQRILDAFPTGHAASQCERAIKMLLGAENSTSHEARELWAKAMKDGCVNDMDIRRSAPHVVTLRMQRQGLAALAPLAAELEKACKPQGRMRSVFASVYHDLASSAARHEDCDAYRAWSVKYLDVGGSVSELMAYHKNYTPWCELQDVTRSVLWFFARLDENWEFELDHNLVSFLSHDGKKLTLTGSHDGAPSYTLDLVLEATGPGAFTCQSARWQRPKEKTQSGTCTVTLTKIAREKDDYDEGTFSATFIEEEGDRHFKQELGNGKFRLRRQ